MKKLQITSLVIALFVIMFNVNVFATDEVSPGSLTKVPDFNSVTRGLYYDGNDFYYLLDTGIPATNYMYNMDGDRFYFGDDGKMVKNDLVEYESEKYFFDENGAMMKNRWATRQEVDPYDGTVEKTSYYFGPTGRAYRASDGQGVVVKTIDGERFGFNVDGERLSGYVTQTGEVLDEDDTYAYAECMYYFDPLENDSAATGWHLYTGLKDTSLYEDDKEMYLYFDEKTCRKVHSTDSEKYLRRTIEGERYMFNDDGVRFFKWYGNVASKSISPKFYNEDYDGFLAKGWFSAVPADTSSREKNQTRNTNQEEVWFYADSKGRLLRSCIKKIGAYTYAFDEDGVMQEDALVVVKDGIYQRSYDVEDLTRKEVLYAGTEGGLLQNGEKWMYFTSPSNENLIGSMCTLNKSVKIELKDDDVVFVANNKGGYSQENTEEVFERNGKLFQNGCLLIPKDDYKYGVVRRSKIDVSHEEPGSGDTGASWYYAIVDNSGNVKTKFGAYKDDNGNYVLSRNNGEFVGVYSVQAEYRVSQNKWRYKVDKTWIDGFPPQDYWIDPVPYLVNCDAYENGYAEDYANVYRK